MNYVAGGLLIGLGIWQYFNEHEHTTDSHDEHSHDHADEASDQGLYGMAALAFALGFAHSEEFDIIAVCTGSTY